MHLHHIDHGGAGAPLVLLHGGSAHAHWWDFVAPELTDRFHVYAPDLRGHGESAWSAEGAYRVADYAADVDEWVRMLGLERPIVVGHSLGSFVALRHAVAHRPRLRALVLVDGRVTFGESASRYMRLLRMLAPTEHATLEDAVRAFRLLPSETTASPEVLEHVARRSFRRNGDGKWVAKFDRATLAAHEPFDHRGDLGALRCPVLFVRGGSSAILSAEAAAAFAGGCREGEWIEIPGAHHHVPLDRPLELARAIAAFLDGR